MTAKMPTPLDARRMRDRVIVKESREFVSWMKGQRFMVTDPSVYNSMMGYIGRVGTSKYNSVVESYTESGYAVVLVFEDGSSDGFRLSELTIIS